MGREVETAGPPFRGAPLVPVLVPPTPIITARDQDGELLLEVRSSTRGFKLATQVAGWIGMAGFAVAVFQASTWVPAVLVGAFAIPVLFAIRRSTITTTLRLHAGTLMIEEVGLMHSSVHRIPLADLEVPLVDSRASDDGPEYSLLVSRAGVERRIPVRLLVGHQQEH
jgi:hypothetical protein